MGGHGVAAATVAVAALLAGCSDPSDSAASAEGPETSAVPGVTGFSVADALAEVPESVGRSQTDFTILAGDLTAASEMGDLDRPADPASAGAWVASLNGAMVDGEPPPVYVPLAVPLAPSSPAELVEKDLGWSIVDVDHFVSWTSAQVTTTVVAGNFDEQTLAGLPAVGGISSAGEGPDLTGDLDSASPARPLGNPLRMAVQNGRLIASPLTPVVRDWHDDSQPTLADDPVLSDLAAVLDDAGAVSAKIATPRSVEEVGLPPNVLQMVLAKWGPFPKFDAYAIGWTADGDEPRFVVAYHTTGDENLARDQVAARWGGIDFRGFKLSDVVEISDVRTRGDLVVVSGVMVPGHTGAVVMQMSEASDLPFTTD